MEKINQAVHDIFQAEFSKLVISNKRSKSNETARIVVEPVIIKKKECYKHTQFIEKKAICKNHQSSESKQIIIDSINHDYKQLDAFTSTKHICIMVSKKGKVSVITKGRTVDVSDHAMSHNREKNYILKEGVVVPPLVDIGVMDANGRVKKALYSKFKQINRFLEMIDDLMIDENRKAIKIVDFGSGKAYLTFIMYYYFTQIKKYDTTITGVDLKRDVVNNCNQIAEKHNYTQLKFVYHDISTYNIEKDTNMVICLHACDTATDYALNTAIKSGVEFILSVPCCQHELNKTIKNESLNTLLKYGIFKERFSAILTDSIRARILEYCGYKVQVLEFVTLEHSSKNVLIRAKKNKIGDQQKKQIKEEITNLITSFNIKQTLYDLIFKENQRD